jgi:hypothetical protein
MNNIGQFGDLPYIPNRLSPPPSKETPNATNNPVSRTPVNVNADQFISNPIASFGLVKSPKTDKKNINDTDAKDVWASLVEPEIDVNAVLPIALNAKQASVAFLQLTELSEGKESVMTALMKNIGQDSPDTLRLVGFMSNLA